MMQWLLKLFSKKPKQIKVKQLQSSDMLVADSTLLDIGIDTKSVAELIFREIAQEIASERVKTINHFSDEKLKELFKKTVKYVLKDNTSNQVAVMANTDFLSLNSETFATYCLIFMQVAKALNIEATVSSGHYLHINKADMHKACSNPETEHKIIDEAARKLLSVGVYR